MESPYGFFIDTSSACQGPVVVPIALQTSWANVASMTEIRRPATGTALVGIVLSTLVLGVPGAALASTAGSLGPTETWHTAFRVTGVTLGGLSLLLDLALIPTLAAHTEWFALPAVSTRE
jgi:hypothetical protein